jgi:HD-like signal output (HDOD) protein
MKISSQDLDLHAEIPVDDSQLFDLTGNQTRFPDRETRIGGLFCSKNRIMSNAATTSTSRFGPPSVLGKPVVSTAEDRAAALQFLGELAAEVSGGNVNLPCFPDVLIRIRKALADPDARLTQTVKIVGAEPRLAARLLQAANSAAFNHSGKPLTDLRAAVTRLGHRAVQSSAMAFAVQQMRLAPALRTIAKPLNVLWEESISVASLCQVIARRTHVSPDEAFLTGLLHGIGRLYIMVRAVGKSSKLNGAQFFMEMAESWHPAIGKAVLENWGFAQAMSDAVGLQADYDRAVRSEADLTDILIVSVVLALVLRHPGPRTVAMDGIISFQRLGLTTQDCANVLKHAEHQLGSLHASLGC